MLHCSSRPSVTSPPKSTETARPTVLFLLKTEESWAWIQKQNMMQYHFSFDFLIFTSRCVKQFGPCHFWWHFGFYVSKSHHRAWPTLYILYHDQILSFATLWLLLHIGTDSRTFVASIFICKFKFDLLILSADKCFASCGVAFTLREHLIRDTVLTLVFMRMKI